jgi:hypothetical protein
MHEFRPLERPSAFRWVFAAILAVISVLPVGLTAVAWSLGPVSYTIRGGDLVIETGDVLFFRARTVHLADIREARPVTLTGGSRTSGSALPGYCTGHFRYAGVGDVWVAGDCGSRGVLLRVAGEDRPIALTPPDAETFLADLRAGNGTRVALPPPDAGGFRVFLCAFLLALLVTAGMTLVLLVLGPSRMLYVVGDGALEVRTLYGRQRFALAGAEARAHRPARLWRVGGAAMPGYYTGRFREDGVATRVYATDVKDVVLVQAEKARVIVSPRNREGFLAALRAEGAEVRG